MAASVYRWSAVEPDNPIEGLLRRRLFGARMMVAKVRLEPGCHVATHTHDSEQIAMIVQGRVVFRLGEPGSSEYEEREVVGGDVVVLPSNFPHGVDAIEATDILDVLCPIGEMGVDRQGAIGEAES